MMNKRSDACRANPVRDTHIDTHILSDRIERYRLAGRIGFVTIAALLALFGTRPVHAVRADATTTRVVAQSID
jgi:hypothetical protein